MKVASAGEGDPKSKLLSVEDELGDDEEQAALFAQDNGDFHNTALISKQFKRRCSNCGKVFYVTSIKIPRSFSSYTYNNKSL